MPLLDFCPDWPRRHYELDAGLTVMPVDDATSEALQDWDRDFFRQIGEVEWLAATRFLVSVTPRVLIITDEPMEDWKEGEGPQIPHGVHREFGRELLTALNLLKLHRCVIPFVLGAEVRTDGDTPHVAGVVCQTYEAQEWLLLGRYYADPKERGDYRCYGESDPGYMESDLQPLFGVWRGIAELSGHSALHREAEQSPDRAKPAYADLQSPRRRDRTRLGRALGLFEAGLDASPLHAFISMVVVLEALYNDGSQNVSDTIAQRAARFLARECPSESARYHESAKRVYSMRNRVVHGNATVGKESPFLYQAILLAQRSLREILLERRAFEAYTRGQWQQQEARVSAFFRLLDNGTDGQLRMFLSGKSA